MLKDKTINLVKRRKYIFIILFLTTFLFAGNSNTIASENHDNIECGKIKNSIENCICKLQERLQHSKFEHPQQNNISFTSHAKNSTSRRTHNDTKSGCCFNSCVNKIKAEYHFALCHKAVIQYCHTRRYYIYALRHILI